jgi:hypothetical protein
VRRVRNVAGVLLVAGAMLAGAGALAAGEGPVWGSQWVGGRDLPQTFGVGLTVYEQRQAYKIDRLSIGVPGFDNIPLSGLDIDNRIREVDGQFDAWLLPFLNVMVVGGHINGRTVVDFSSLSLPFPLDRVTVDYTGEVYGGGVNLAAGNDRFFTSVSTLWTRTSLSGDFDSSADAFVAMPRFGIHDQRGAFWLGAMYQRTDEKHSGIIALPYVGPVPFRVQLSQKHEWNGLVGMHAALDKHWNLELEGGFGDRRSASATVTWRF